MGLRTEQPVARATHAAPVAPRARRSWSRHSNRSFYLFIAPWLLGFIGLTVIPLVYALGVSFTNYDGMSPHWHWLGLDNYRELIGDSDTWYSLGRTLLFAAIAVPISVSAGLGLALLLNRRLRAVGVFRTIFYVPSVVPIVATAVMWKIMFDRDAGMLNGILELFGVQPVLWLVDPTAFTALVIMVLWGLGGGMVIFLAGLQGIPHELREAAAVDGANAVQVFRSVVLPLLTPVLFFQVITGIINALQVLIPALLLTNGSGSGNEVQVPPRSNYLYMVHVYLQFFANQRFGYGAALLWVLFAVVLMVTLLVFRSSTLWVYYEVEQKGG